MFFKKRTQRLRGDNYGVKVIQIESLHSEFLRMSGKTLHETE